MNFRTFHLMILALALSAACAAQELFPVPEKAEPASGGGTSFELIDNRIFVNVRINGRGPFHFILDSGADGNLMREEAAKSLGLKKEEAQTGLGTGAAQEDGWNTHVATLQVGAVTLRNQEMTVLPFADTVNLFGKVRVDGILGLTLFRQSVVRIDYQRRTVSFTPFDKFIYTGSGKVLSFDANADIPIVFANLDGVPAGFGIDTGAKSALLLYAPFVEKNFLRNKYEPKVEGITGWGFGGPVRTQLARGKRLTLGGLEVNNMVLRLMTKATGSSANANYDGVIGADVLRQFGLIFDYKHSQLILEPNASFGKQDSYDRAGMWLAQNGSDFSVLDVIAGGPAADAGLKIGDKVAAVNGVPAAKLSLPELREKLKDDAPGTKLRLTVIESAGADPKDDPPVVALPNGDKKTASKIAPAKKDVTLVLRDVV